MNDIKILLSAVESIENIFNCKLSFHDYSGELRRLIPKLPHYHLNPFCTVLKFKNPSFNSGCVAFDRYEVQKRLAAKDQPLIKLCHHGFIEIVVPLKFGQKISGAIFAGPFNWHSDKLPAEILKAKGKISKCEHKLPEINHEQTRKLSSLLQLCGSNIEKIIFQERAKVRNNLNSRPEKIMAFIDDNFQNDIALRDLSKSLLLCESRTSQLLKALFGKSFTVLLTDRRIEHAKSLLKNSMFHVELIANLSGFSDGSYFHRVFKKQTGITPRQYRKSNHKY